MADEPQQSKPKRAGTPAGGRPGKTRLPGAEGTKSGRVTPSPKASPSKPAPRSVWQNGYVRFAIVVLVALAALGATYRFEWDPAEVDMAGGDPAAFCDKIVLFRAMQPGNFNLSVETAADTFAAQQQQLEQLATVAPTDLRPDLERIAASLGATSAKAKVIADRKKADPSYSLQALPDLLAAFDDMDAANKKEGDRVAYAAAVGCNVHFDEPSLSSTSVPPSGVTTTSVPGGGPDGSTPPGSGPGVDGPVLSPGPVGPAPSTTAVGPTSSSVSGTTLPAT